MAWRMTMRTSGRSTSCHRPRDPVSGSRDHNDPQRRTRSIPRVLRVLDRIAAAQQFAPVRRHVAYLHAPKRDSVSSLSSDGESSFMSIIASNSHIRKSRTGPQMSIH